MLKNIDQAFDDLVHSTEGMTHETVTPEQIRPSGLTTVSIHGDPFKLSRSAAEELRSRLGIPADFLSRLESPTCACSMRGTHPAEGTTVPTQRPISPTCFSLESGDFPSVQRYYSKKI